MILGNKDIIEYEGISNIKESDYIYEGLEEVSIIIDKDFSNNNLITKASFNLDLIKLDSVLSIENRDIFIFHIKINIDVEYIEDKSSSGIRVKQKEFITSKILEVSPSSRENDYIGGKAFLVDGFIGAKDDILYSNLVLLLTLGGTSLC